MIRAIVPMTLLAVGAWATWPPSPPPAQPPVAKAEPEGVRRIDLDTRSFRVRWLPVGDMLPAVMIQTVVEERVVVAATEAGLPPPRARPAAPPRLDVCARHGMRRVTEGRRWRCRR
jgi:hypothetical protein